MIGRLVRERREARGWTQTRLAQEAGMPQTYISKVERGDVEIPQRHTLEKIGKALGVRLSEFYRAAGVYEPLPGDEVGGINDDLIAVLEMRPVLGEQVRALRAKYGEARFRRIMGPVLRAWQSNLEMATEVALDAAENGSENHRRE